MALRLRRGTDAERQTITPLEGELIYTTDTEKLYVGDGTTVGGNPIDSDTITDQLSDLSDVVLVGLQDGQTIAYDANNNRFEPADLASSINDLTDVDTTGVEVGEILKWNGAAFVAAVEGNLTPSGTYDINIDGDVTGSVFGDDSTLLIDGINNQLRVAEAVVDSTGFFFRDGTSGDGPTNIYVEALLGQSRLTFTSIDDDNDLSLAGNNYGRINFSRRDVNGETPALFIQGGADGFRVKSEGSAKNYPVEAQMRMDIDGNFIIGGGTPTERLEVVGNALVSGSVTASSFDGDLTGSIFTDTSTMLIDGTDGKLMVANANIVGETGNTPLTPGTVDSWLEVTVNGATKYIPLYV